VRNIEKLGVHMGIIADDKSEDSENLIMSDDGTGSTINIPSFIIRKKDADLIKSTLSGVVAPVYIKAELDITHPDNRVEYELWYSTVLDTQPYLLYDISLYQKALGSNALFTPRILTYSCRGCSEEMKSSVCLADGRYCPYFPKEKIPERMVGIQDGLILYESLRQRCVYEVITNEQEYGDKQGASTLEKWFAYTVNFQDNCFDKNMFGEECAVAQLKKAGVNHEKVATCIHESFVRNAKGEITDNRILSEDAKWASLLGIFLHPSITVNNITYRGDLNGYDIFRAVCAGFKEQPQVCKGDEIFNQMNSLEQSSPVSPQARASVIKGHHILLAIVVVMLINFSALYLYRRHHRQKMNTELQMQVNSAVSQYFRLSGQDA
jgi:hypothetical protein